MNLPNMGISPLKPATSFLTDRLFIRKHQLADAPLLYEAAKQSTVELQPFLPWCHGNYQPTETHIWLCHCIEQWTANRMFTFSIFEQSSGVFVGTCGLNRTDDHPYANLGYWIRTDVTGQGFATEATEALIKFGFEQAQLVRIEIMMSIHNIGSQRVAEKSSATFEGRLKQRLLLHGKLHDALLYAAIAPPITGLLD